MSRSVDLPEAVYAALEEAATASGSTPAEWIAAHLPKPKPVTFPEGGGSPIQTLAERLKGYVGLVRSGRDDCLERYDGMFADAGEGRDAQATDAHSRMIQVSEDVFRDLESEARTLGTTPAGWIATRLPERSLTAEPDEGAQPPRTLADEFAGYIGLFSSGRGDLSERVSEVFAERMVEKHRARLP